MGGAAERESSHASRSCVVATRGADVRSRDEVTGPVQARLAPTIASGTPHGRYAPCTLPTFRAAPARLCDQLAPQPLSVPDAGPASPRVSRLGGAPRTDHAHVPVALAPPNGARATWQWPTGAAKSSHATWSAAHSPSHASRVGGRVVACCVAAHSCEPRSAQHSTSTAASNAAARLAHAAVPSSPITPACAAAIAAARGRAAWAGGEGVRWRVCWPRQEAAQAAAPLRALFLLECNFMPASPSFEPACATKFRHFSPAFGQVLRVGKHTAPH